MPFTIFGHQSIEFYLIKHKRDKINPTALVLGSIFPDFEVIFSNLHLSQNTHAMHSLVGVLLINMPVILMLTLVLTYFYPLLGRKMLKISFIGENEQFASLINAWLIKSEKNSIHLIAIILLSAAIGGFSHLLLDLPSHEISYIFNPWFDYMLPDPFLVLVIELNSLIHVNFVRDANIYVYVIIWWLETIILGIFSINLLSSIIKDSINKDYKAKNQ